MFGLIVALFLLTNGPPAVTLTLSPLVGYAPLTTIATIRIDPNYENREVCIQWDDSDGPVGRGCWQLDGQYAAITQSYTIKGDRKSVV